MEIKKGNIAGRTSDKHTGSGHAAQRHPGKRRAAVVAAIVAVVAVIAGAVAERTAFSRFGGEEPVRIFIPHGASAEAVADTLQLRLGDDFGRKLARVLALRDADPAKAYGSYVITPGDRVWSVANRLRTGTQTPVKVSFNNIRLFNELAQRIASRFVWNDSAFIAASDSILPARGFSRREQYPAAFVPDSYEFYWTDTPGRVVSTLADYRDRFWTAERRGKAKALGLTPVEVATVASIVEEETAKADERGAVARLYLNRLEKDMPLQADPTVKFAAGDFSLRRIAGDILRNPSPYNTYRTKGLPPGPIRVAEKSAIDAVLNAPAHPYLYMCAKSDFSGYHDFATTFDQHRANAARYQAELNRRNIH